MATELEQEHRRQRRKQRSKRAKRIRRQRVQCQRGNRKRYNSEEEASAVLVALAHHKGIDIADVNGSTYQCLNCEYWHVARGNGDNYAMEKEEENGNIE